MKIVVKIDTGAKAGLLPYLIVEKLRVNFKLKNTKTMLEAYGGKTISNIGLYFLDAEILNHCAAALLCAAKF